MAESETPRVVTPTEAADRDSRTEALLVEGLDRYFAGRYEDAIHLWTRVLFLDRNHARARAYIDRARTALAERQRQSDEMLEASRDLLEQGRTEAARHLLTEAVATTGDDEQAAALRVKLERLERLQGAHLRRRASDRPNAGVPATPRPAWRSRGRSVVRAPRRGGRDRGGPRGSGHAPVGLRLAGSALID